MKKIYLLIILIFFSNYAHSKDYKFLCIPKEISKVYNFKTFKFIDEYFDPYQELTSLITVILYRQTLG